MALKPIALLCFFEQDSKNDDCFNKFQYVLALICRLSGFCQPSRLYHRHRVGIRPPIHTRGSEDSVSCTRQTPSNYYHYHYYYYYYYYYYCYYYCYYYYCYYHYYYYYYYYYYYLHFLFSFFSLYNTSSLSVGVIKRASTGKDVPEFTPHHIRGGHSNCQN